MQSHKLDHSIALDFIFAGNSLFTVLNTNTGNRFTFKVKAAKEEKDSTDTKETHFVRVLTSPDIYEFVGTTFERKYKHSKKSRIGNEAQSVRVFSWIIAQLTGGTLPQFIEIWHEGRCGRCGRVLTVPSSIEVGIGPECAKRTQTKADIRATRIKMLLSQD